ncbi:Peptidase family M1 [Paenibacillus sp. UNCCL117]|uniref:M1 family metallopeptidase n=1 Tax=unclassified Paenibacillus TaxID=185978 RepID=UPI000881BA29|nr:MULTISPECIES: M1 family metallopeptidase [unclassified Paenibacillus]SDD19024.1 Peptidase family M1 [Paenibacillus sp. cl123]SFW35390.1 Peptidase family M1 [Paenibacillus sp. UNCCL117]
MKTRLGKRLAIWGCLSLLACSTALVPGLISTDMRTVPPRSDWQLPFAASSPAGGPVADGGPLILKPALSSGKPAVMAAPAWPASRGAADGSSTGLFLPQDGALPASARRVEPALPPPAPPSLPAKPIEKPAPRPLSNRIVEYHLDAEYDAEGKLIRGTSSLTWKNPGSVPVEELYFHLYPNAFESKKTTFMQESGGKLRDDASVDNNFGGMKLTSVQLLDGHESELVERVEFVRPDDGNVHDRTLARLPLPRSVAPGEEVTLQMAYTVQLPQVFARMGYAGNFVMAGQWYPKIAVYEPKGTRGAETEGWNLHQYHGNSEFYADFGIFDVKVKVPSAYTVAATGFPTKPAVDDGKTKTFTFYADDVHDFAWAASPDFIYAEEPYATKHVPGVRIKLYLDPKHEHLKARYMTAAKKALARYSEWYGSYPYSTLSIVVPPEGGNGAGGMEYPTLVTSWAADEDDPSLELERVIVHEIGHQFFYGMVASNEFEEAWLDEGFTSYAEDRLIEKEYGVRSNRLAEASYITSPASLKQAAWHYGGHGQYAENVYTRAKLVLKAIEAQAGSDAMNKIMRTYFQRWKFKHPGTGDFQKTVEDVTGTSWKEFFDQYVYDGKMTDYAVAGIQVRELEENGQQLYENSVKLRRLGGTAQAVPVRFHFADGTKIDQTWNGAETEVTFTLKHAAPLEWAVIDPQYTLVLENKRINSFMKTNVDTKLSVRLNLGVVKILETFFGWVVW